MQNQLYLHNYFKTQSFSWLLLALLLSLVGCQTGTESDNELNVDRDIPPSEDFDASYGFWGPDGEAIYFTHSEELGSDPDPGKLDQLWKLNLGTEEREMIHTGRILNADISPNGQWFVFHSFAVPQYLYKMKSNGTTLQKLTGPASQNPNWEYTGLGRWSPDGSQILFSVTAGEPRGVALMDSSGSDPNIIIPYGIDAKWFPDGDRITYLNWDTTQVRTKQQQIYTANSNGTHSNKITNIPHSSYYGDISEPAVSPDEQNIVFTNEGKSSNGREVFVMSTDGTQIEQFTEGPGYAARPEWSPDGQTILFSRIIQNVSKRLYYLDVESREVTPVFPN